jgi:hypothetical protein
VYLSPHEVVSKGRVVRTDLSVEACEHLDREQYCRRAGRATAGEFKQFLCIAQGSTYEVHTQLLLAKRLKFGDDEMLRNAEAFCIETSKMLGAFIASLAKKS